MEGYCSAIKETTQGKYQEIMLDLRTQIVGISVYLEFDFVGKFFSLSKICSNFVGFGLSSEHIEELYKILEEYLEYHPKLAMFYANIFQLEKKLK